MKVLITGGYGFVGSHVVEKFYNEGHQTFIIDNLTAGRKSNVKVKHEGFVIHVEDEKCKEIFEENQFDVVVHLAAQSSVGYSIQNPYVDAKSNILGLVNMLHLSTRFGVKKFIFASSAAVYGDNPHIPIKEDAVCKPQSPYGLSKYIGEQYCLNWRQIYGLDTVCFRFSNVYGPRQGANGEGGVVSIFMERLCKNRELIVFGNGKQTRDFIFVEDVANAVFKSSESNLTEVYNISTGDSNSVNDLIDCLKGIQSVQGVINKPARTGDIEHSCLDSTRLKNELQWLPKTTLEEGIKRTYAWYLEDEKGKK